MILLLIILLNFLPEYRISQQNHGEQTHFFRVLRVMVS